jgi:holo-[acyl-carrier protein] synthase
MTRVGIDIVSISRIEKMVDKFGKKSLDRFLNESEQKIAKKTETIAGFWATKEAISKALKCGIGKDLSFLDITISKNNRGAPVAQLSDEVVEKFGIEDLDISITHDNKQAIACAIVAI